MILYTFRVECAVLALYSWSSEEFVINSTSSSQDKLARTKRCWEFEVEYSLGMFMLWRRKLHALPHYDGFRMLPDQSRPSPKTLALICLTCSLVRKGRQKSERRALAAIREGDVTFSA
jgi:hypothetical protein